MGILRFHLLTITHEQVNGSVTVTITTNAACHLYLRYSNIFPRIHRKSVVRRGLVMDWDARFCFTVYQHLEQDEDGDTFTHTFTWPGWENCHTRYFYFWGTMGGQDMVSDTPIFWIHYLRLVAPPPEQTIFYSDPDPEVTSVDGRVGRVWPQQSWSQIRNGIGTRAVDTLSGLIAWIRTTNPAGWNKYYELYRAIMLLDMSIGIGASVASAVFHFYGDYKNDTHAKNPTLNLFSSNPASNIALVPADYGTLGTIPFGTAIAYADFLLNDWNEINLNAQGIAHINAALASDGIVKLGYREASWDAANNDPFYNTPNAKMAFGALDTDTADPTKRPYLEVVWVQ